MKTALYLNRNLLHFGIPALLFGVIILLLKLPISLESSSLSLAITIDLVITVPLVYILLIRKTDIPKTTVIPIMIIGLVIGSFLLPAQHQDYLNLFKTWALPIIEISAITLLILKVRNALKKYKNLKTNAPDFYTALKETCIELFPRIAANAITTEVAVFYYGLVHWKPVPLKNNEFSYHEKSNTPIVLFAFILVVAAEAVGLHALIAKWNVIVAWVITLLSVYSAFQLLGIAKSLSKRPIRLTDSNLVLNYGILSDVEIPFSAIKSIELFTKEIEPDAGIKTLSPLSGMDSTNIVLHLNDEFVSTGLYGIKKRFQTLAFHVDEPVRFTAVVQEKVSLLAE